MVIITGASKGIGRYLFTEFSNNGFDVIGTYKSENQFISNKIPNYYKVDISNYFDVENWFNSVKNKLENITLINCAGINYNSFAHKADINTWKTVIDVNLIGTFNVIRNFLPLMRDQNFGRIINLSSVVTKLPTLGVSAYAASKSGLIGLTKSLAAENASKGITINSINLGYVNLGMAVEQIPQSNQENLITKIPAGRFCEPIEIYKTITYLMETEYVNGASIDINGALI